VDLACPDCRDVLAGDPLRCAGCGRAFESENGIPVLLPSSMLGDTEQRQHALYAAVAHEYDDVFPRHVAEHYIDKRTGLIKELLPIGGLVLGAHILERLGRLLPGQAGIHRIPEGPRRLAKLAQHLGLK